MIRNLLTALFLMTAVVCTSQCSRAQPPTSAPSKDGAVKQLVELTAAGHPSFGLDEVTAKLPKDKESEEMIKRNQTEIIDMALKENKNLTPEQRSFVKANYDQIGKLLDKATAEAKKKSFDIDKWVSDSLQKLYAEKLTDGELGELITYFQGTAGKSALTYIKTAQYSEVFVKAGAAPLYTIEDKAERDRFAATPLGTKFLAIFLVDTNAEVQAKMDTAYKNNTGELFAVNNVSNVNAIIDKFVAENYKK